MAISFAVVTNWRGTYTSVTPATSFGSDGAYTALSGKGYLCFVTLSYGSGTSGTATLTGGGLTWALVTPSIRHSGNGVRQLHVFRSAGAGASGALTFTKGGAEDFAEAVMHTVELTDALATGTSGVDMIGTIATDNTLATTTPSVSITNGAPSTSGIIAAFGLYASVAEVSAVRSGYTLLDEDNVRTVGESVTQAVIARTTDDTAASLTWSEANNGIAVAVEIKAALLAQTVNRTTIGQSATGKLTNITQNTANGKFVRITP